MSRKFTLTVPDELGAKIDKYRTEINLSDEFRKVMEQRIEELEIRHAKLSKVKKLMRQEGLELSDLKHIGELDE